MRFLLLFLFIMFNLSAMAEGGRIAAVVNGDIITSKEVDDFLKLIKYGIRKEGFSLSENDRKKALDSLIEDKLILQQAKKLNAVIPDELVEKKLNEIISTFPSPKEYEQSLIERGLNEDMLRKKIRDQILLQEFIRQRIKTRVHISPQEITSYYLEHKKEFVAPETLYYYAVVFDSLGKAKENYKKMQNMDAIAIKFGYKDRVIYSRITKEQARKELKDVLFNSSDSQVLIPPVKIDNSYFIFYIDRRIPAHQLDLEDVKDKIYNILFAEKFKKVFAEWIEEVKKNSVIKIYE